VGSGALSGTVTNGGTLALNIADPGPPPIAFGARGVTNIAGTGAWQGSLPVVTPELAGMTIIFEVTRQ
jgi:hypothetical protein